MQCKTMNMWRKIGSPRDKYYIHRPFRKLYPKVILKIQYSIWIYLSSVVSKWKQKKRVDFVEFSLVRSNICSLFLFSISLNHNHCNNNALAIVNQDHKKNNHAQDTGNLSWENPSQSREKPSNPIAILLREEPLSIENTRCQQKWPSRQTLSHNRVIL
jgi:hypothetical protein